MRQAMADTHGLGHAQLTCMRSPLAPATGCATVQQFLRFFPFLHKTSMHVSFGFTFWGKIIVYIAEPALFGRGHGKASSGRWGSNPTPHCGTDTFWTLIGETDKRAWCGNIAEPLFGHGRGKASDTRRVPSPTPHCGTGSFWTLIGETDRRAWCGEIADGWHRSALAILEPSARPSLQPRRCHPRERRIHLHRASNELTTVVLNTHPCAAGSADR